ATPRSPARPPDRSPPGPPPPPPTPPKTQTRPPPHATTTRNHRPRPGPRHPPPVEQLFPDLRESWCPTPARYPQAVTAASHVGEVHRMVDRLAPPQLEALYVPLRALVSPLRQAAHPPALPRSHP